MEPTLELNKLILERKSRLAFSKQSLTKEQIELLFEAARWSPSASNEQGWRFLYATPDDKDIYQKLVSTLMGSNAQWASQAPLLVLNMVQKNHLTSGKPYKHAWYDLGQAVAWFTVQATSMNLNVHQMGGFDANLARTLFQIPEEIELVTIMAVGRAGTIEQLPETLRVRETATRKRKDLKDLFFHKN